MRKYGLKRQQFKIDCKEVQKMVIPYIQKELSNHDMRIFIKHIQNCAECREELETYYIVYKGLMQLDEKENLPMNMMKALDEELNGSKAHLRNMSLFYAGTELLQILSTLLTVGVGIYLVMQLF